MILYHIPSSQMTPILKSQHLQARASWSIPTSQTLHTQVYRSAPMLKWTWMWSPHHWQINIPLNNLWSPESSSLVIDRADRSGLECFILLRALCSLTLFKMAFISPLISQGFAIPFAQQSRLFCVSEMNRRSMMRLRGGRARHQHFLNSKGCCIFCC